MAGGNPFSCGDRRGLFGRPLIFDRTKSSLRSVALVDAQSRSAYSGDVGERGFCCDKLCRTDDRGWTVAGLIGATVRYGIGDIVGVLALAPFALFALSGRRILPLSLETVLQCAAVLVALMMVFGLAEEREFQLFYVLFLPIVWMAVRNGIEGVSAGILITQIGVVLGLAFVPDEREELVALQSLMLVLTVTGLIAGGLVTERRRMESQLQMQRESLAGLARLGSLGELAAAVAHEVNQPLMAAGTDARLVADTVSSGSASANEIAEIAKKAIGQVDRAAEVIRRLRALVRLDRSNRAPVPFDRIIKETLDLSRPDLDRAGGAPRVALPPDLPLITVDILQIEQVLLNLVRNSIEAIRDSGSPRGTNFSSRQNGLAVTQTANSSRLG